VYGRETLLDAFFKNGGAEASNLAQGLVSIEETMMSLKTL